MSAIAILILVILIIVALLLIVLVLLQDEGGEGLGGIFGGGSSQQVGSRSGDTLTRITSILGTIFIVSALSLGWLIRSSDVDNVEQAAQELQVEEGQESVLQWWESLDDDAAEGDGAALDSDNFLQELLRNQEEQQ